MSASTPTRRWAATLSTLAEPLQWFEPHRIHLDADLFDGSVSLKDIARVYAVMQLSQHHTFLVLTKHPDAMLSFYEWVLKTEGGRAAWLAAVVGAPDGKNESWSTAWPFRNVWLGVSIEDQDTADERIPILLQCPAAVRWVSAEPLLGPVNLRSSVGGTLWIGGQRGCGATHHGEGTPQCPRELHHHHDDRCKRGLDWVVVGGESGPGARPMHPDWAWSLRDQCVWASVPFLFKQWGDWKPISEYENGARELYRDAGRYDDDYPDELRDKVCKVPVGVTRHDGQFFELGEAGAFELRSGRPAYQTFRVGKRVAGRELDGKVWDEFPGETLHE